jgi:hypothetical protein
VKAMRDRLTYANVIATPAPFVALGGVSWAAVNLPAGSVSTKQFKKSSVGSRQLKDRSVDAEALQGNAVGYDQLAPLCQIPSVS